MQTLRKKELFNCPHIDFAKVTKFQQFSFVCDFTQYFVKQRSKQSQCSIIANGHSVHELPILYKYVLKYEISQKITNKPPIAIVTGFKCNYHQ